MTTPAQCPNGNEAEAYNHGYSDAINDGIDTFIAFSQCRCQVCLDAYLRGVDAGMKELHDVLGEVTK